MGVELKKSSILGEGVLWEGHCGDWTFQIRKVKLGDRQFLQARVSQRYTWIEPGPTLNPTMSAWEPTLWFQTWDLEPNELRTLVKKRSERENSVAKFLYG
jgi:hypothetical protein